MPRAPALDRSAALDRAAAANSADLAVNSCCRSFPQCCNTMDARFTEIGVLVADGGSYGVHSTQVFARPW